MSDSSIEKYIKDLSPELQEKARACENTAELLKLADENDFELSADELEAINGGTDRDYLVSGCAATVEVGSTCASNDACAACEVSYENKPVKICKKCGGKMRHPHLLEFGAGVVGWVCMECDYKDVEEYRANHGSLH